ncbi:hypothetical protein Tco_0322187 [Tanacetum coccineum]
MELCNGSSIGEIMSDIDVSANDDLPSVLEITYPPIGNSSTKAGKLDVKYQWKPPLCTHCKTFGHSTLSCKVRPRSEVEKVVAILKEALNVSYGPSSSADAALNDDEFVTVGKKNKPFDNKKTPSQDTPQVKHGFKMQYRGGFNTGRQSGNGFYQYGKQDGDFFLGNLGLQSLTIYSSRLIMVVSWEVSYGMLACRHIGRLEVLSDDIHFNPWRLMMVMAVMA